MRRLWVVVHIAVALWIATSGRVAAIGVIVCLLGSLEPVVRAYLAAWGTANRGIAVWSGLALLLGVVCELDQLHSLSHAGSESVGIWIYVCLLLAVAAMASVLNARQPGAGAWSVLMGLLVLVFLFAWAQEHNFKPAYVYGRRVELVFPWSLFLGLLMFVGGTNFLPTRYFFASLAILVGFGLGLFDLVKSGGQSTTVPSQLWSPLLFSAAAQLALLTAYSNRGFARSSRSDMDTLWLWFRDHWGIAWGLRVKERYNQSAEARSWPLTLGWEGFERTKSADDSKTEVQPSDEQMTMLRDCLRRFASSERLDAVLARGRLASPSCEKTDRG